MRRALVIVLIVAFAGSAFAAVRRRHIPAFVSTRSASPQAVFVASPPPMPGIGCNIPAALPCEIGE